MNAMFSWHTEEISGTRLFALYGRHLDLPCTLDMLTSASELMLNKWGQSSLHPLPIPIYKDNINLINYLDSH